MFWFGLLIWNNLTDKRDYNIFVNKLYKCITSHTSTEETTPSSCPYLWHQLVDLTNEWPSWSFPINKQTAYHAGALVYHNGHYWRSLIDNNIWEPSVQGWDEIQ